jgi:hypothetical protein
VPPEDVAPYEAEDVPPYEADDVPAYEAPPDDMPAYEVPPEDVLPSALLVDEPQLAPDDVPPDGEVVPDPVPPEVVLPARALGLDELAGERPPSVTPEFRPVLGSPAPIGDGPGSEPWSLAEPIPASRPVTEPGCCPSAADPWPVGTASPTGAGGCCPVLVEVC